MRLFHLCASHDTSRPTGVNRFSGYFKRVFPECFNITPGTVRAVEFSPDDVIVADNHLAMLVPQPVRVIVVHHGCAPYHREVDAIWRGPEIDAMCDAQKAMLTRPNTSFVAPSAWVASKFGQLAGWERRGKVIDRKGYEPVVVPHWVEENPRPLRFGRPTEGYRVNPVIIGDWRTLNKGSGVIDKYREAMPQYEFRQLDFPSDDAAKREAFYRSADVYLCLSLSEGAPYSVADAEAASLPIVSTMVGNCMEFPADDFYGISTRFHPMHGVEEAANAIRAALENGRRTPSFYRDFTFEKWKAEWSKVIGS